MNRHRTIHWSIILILLGGIFAVGCAAQLSPQVSYQGRLTDAGGTPLNGDYQLTFGLYDDASGGTLLYSETDSVAVESGLFDTVVGPGTAVSGVAPEDLAQPLWLEVMVSNGTLTETLTPRQRLYGAPYAFTLMPGAVVSSTMASSVYGAAGIDGVMSVINTYDGDGSDPASPALKVVGENGLELASPTTDDGIIKSNQSTSSSDLFIYSRDNIQFYLDEDNNETGTFSIIGNGGQGCTFYDNGSYSCSGTKSASVALDGEQRLMYAMESPEVWFEDFGQAALVNGSATVTIDPLFAEATNLSAYHVFVTPLGDCRGLYVGNKTETGFEVHELAGGTSDVAFDYRIVAHRSGYEGQRLEPDRSATSELERGEQ